jgi:hypothetical protein
MARIGFPCLDPLPDRLVPAEVMVLTSDSELR